MSKKVIDVSYEAFRDDYSGCMEGIDTSKVDVRLVDKTGKQRGYMSCPTMTRWDFTMFTRDEYDRLVNELQNAPEVKYASYCEMAMKHPAYKDMVDAGKAALPFIFEDLRNRDDLYTIWAFPAIQDILGDEAPNIPEEIKGKVDRMIDTYLEWAEENGY